MSIKSPGQSKGMVYDAGKGQLGGNSAAWRPNPHGSALGGNTAKTKTPPKNNQMGGNYVPGAKLNP